MTNTWSTNDTLAFTADFVVSKENFLPGAGADRATTENEKTASSSNTDTFFMF